MVGKGKIGTHFIIVNLIRFILLLAFFGAVINQRWLVMFVSVLAFFFTFLPYFFEKGFNIKIPADFEILVILFIYGSLFFGEVRGFYSSFWWWSLLLNLFSSIALGVVGLTVLYVLYKDDKLDASPFIIVFFAFCFSVAMGALWEIFEFTMDSFFGFHIQGDSVFDTMMDMIVNILGSFVVALGGYFYIRSGKTNLVSRFISEFVDKNPRLFRGKRDISLAESVSNLIEKGEGRSVELKPSLRVNSDIDIIDKRVSHSILKTIVSFMNSDGGHLLIGVSDDKKIIGIEKDGFQSDDKAILHLTNLIKTSIGGEFLPYVKADLVKLDNLSVVKVECSPSDKPVFLNIGKDEEFYVRNGPSNVNLSGRALIDYIERRFRDRG